MCGPVAAAFALSNVDAERAENRPVERGSQLDFHLLLNLGRLLSYAVVGAAIGALGFVVFAAVHTLLVGSHYWGALALT